jgi:hypothetical protein
LGHKLDENLNFLHASTDSSAGEAPSGRPCPSDAELIALISAGGGSARAAAATLLIRHQALIRRRLRRKLSASARRMFDSEDLFSTVARRIDVELEQQRLAALTEQQFWALIQRIGENCVSDVSRSDRTWQSVRRELVRDRRAAGPPEPQAPRLEEAQKYIRWAATTEEDRQVVALKRLGAPYAAIGHILGLTEQAVRKRWHRLSTEIRDLVRRDSARRR